jgi:hypothetical protein
MSDKATHAYLGIASCGCVMAMTVDNPEHKKDVAKDVASFMRWGATIERVSIEYARKAFCGSSHGKKGDNCPHPNACPDKATAAP